MPSLSLSIGVISFLNRREERVASASLLLGPTTTAWDPAAGVWLKTPPIKQLEAPFAVLNMSPIETLAKPRRVNIWMPPVLMLAPMVMALAAAPLLMTLMPPDVEALPMRMALFSPAVPCVAEPMQILLLSVPL